jgi:hypothetical protein
MKETFSGHTHKIIDLKTAGRSTVSILTFEKLDEENKPVNERPVWTQVYKGETLVEETGFHSNGKVASYWYSLNGQTNCRTYFNERGQKTEQWILNGDRPESQRVYDPATGRDHRFRVFDESGNKIHQVSWQYESNGDVIKRARDYQEEGTQEIQRREWINDVASAYYLLDWSVKGNDWVCVVERHYEDGRLVSDVERAPDGTLVKDHRWNWVRTSVLTISGGKPKTTAKWTAIPTLRYGIDCYELDKPQGFGLGYTPEQLNKDLENGRDEVGAQVAPVGKVWDETVARPMGDQWERAEAEYQARYKAKIEAIGRAGDRALSVIGASFQKLFNANNALKAIRKATQSGMTWQDLKERAGIASKNAISEGKEVASDIKEAPADAAAARDKIVRDAKSEVDSAKSDIDKAQKEVGSAHEKLTTTAGGVVTAGKSVWEETKKAAEPIVQMVKAVLTEDLIKVEADSVGKMSFNFATGGYYADFELLKGWKLDSEGFKALMTGDFRLPEIDPLTAAQTLTDLKTSVTTNYETVRQAQYSEHGGANVYFASRRLTEWAGPGTALRDGTLAVFGDGEQAIAEAKSHLSLELEDLVTWLQQCGAKDAPKLAVKILHAIATQTPIEVPGVLSLKSTPVNYTYKYSAGGAAATVANAVGVDASASATTSHFGFAIVWEGDLGSDPLLDSINNFQSMKLQGGMDDFNALALEELDKLDLPGSDFLKEILLTGHVGVDSDNALDKTVMNKFTEMFGIDASELLAAYESGNPIIDLSQNSKIKNSLTSQLKGLAIGNDKSAEVTKLQFNLNTMSFEAEFVVHHKYASGSLADIGKDLVGMVS